MSVLIGNDIAAFAMESISGGAVIACNAAAKPLSVHLPLVKAERTSIVAVTPLAICLLGTPELGIRSVKPVPIL